MRYLIVLNGNLYMDASRLSKQIFNNIVYPGKSWSAKWQNGNDIRKHAKNLADPPAGSKVIRTV